jgi:hypothetical protein
MDEVIYISYTMIALHYCDSTTHLIASPQIALQGFPATFGGSSFRSPAYPRVKWAVTHNHRNLYRSGVIHFSYL